MPFERNKRLTEKLAFLSGVEEAQDLIIGEFPSISEIQNIKGVADGAMAVVSDTATIYTYNLETDTWSAGAGGSGINNLSEDPSPDLGGDLNLNNNDITGTGNINITGGITATTFTVTSLTPGSTLTVTLPDTTDSDFVVEKSDSTPLFGAYQTASAVTLLLGGPTTLTGDLTVTGNVDGRDVNADGTALDRLNIDGVISDIGTPASGDKVLIQDASNADSLRYASFSEFGGGGGSFSSSDITGQSAETAATGDSIVFSDVSDTDALKKTTMGDLMSAPIIDNTNFDVLTETSPQALWVENDLALLNARTTGIRYGGIATVNGGAGVGTTLDITAGAGQILDNTDAQNPTFTQISWSAITNEALVTTSPSITYWYFDDNSGSIKQTTTEPTRDDYRTRIYITRTSFTGGVISGIAAIPSTIQQEGLSLFDFTKAFGAIRSDGLVPSASGANLKLAISAGGIFDYGSNYASSYTDPHVTSFAAYDSNVADDFRYVIPSGSITSDVTDIDVGNYAPAGVVTAIPGASTRVGIHFIFRFAGGSGNVRIAYGDEFYTSVADAQAALTTINPLDLAPASFANAFLIGAIIATKAETNLQNATFISSNILGGLGGSVGFTGGVTDHGNLTGLTDDDHTQYSLISSQAGAPGTTPSRVGNINIDTTNDVAYISTGTASSADWQEQVVVDGTSLADGEILIWDATNSKFVRDNRTTGTTAVTTIDMNSIMGNFYSTTTASTASSYTLQNVLAGGKATIRIQEATAGGPTFSGTGLTITKKGDWTNDYDTTNVNIIYFEAVTSTLIWAFIAAVEA